MTKEQTTRFLRLEDLFTVTCNRCGSTDVDLWAEECGECGTNITATCNKCNLKYNYHNFKQIKVSYDAKGKEISKEQGW